MKVGWKSVPLGEVCSFENGDRGENYPGRKAFVPEGVPFVNAGHLSDGLLNLSEMNFIPREHFNRIGAGKLRLGDLLFCLRGSLGKFALVDNLDEGAIASSLVIVRPNSRLEPKFLKLYFGSKLCAEMIASYANGTAQPNLAARSLASFQLPLPPLEEQQLIVAIMEETFEALARARSHAEANLRDARELFASFLCEIARRHAETYGTATVEALAEDVSDGDHMPPPKADVGIPFITISNVNKDTRQIDFSDTFMVPEAYYNALKGKRQPRAGDVLYTVTGSFGIPILIEGGQPFCFQRHIALVRPKAGVDSEWLYYMLLSPFAFDQANDGATGTAQRTVSLKVLRGLTLPNTPIEMQPELAANLRSRWDANQTIVESYRAKIADIDTLRQSLLQKAFAGELT